MDVSSDDVRREGGGNHAHRGIRASLSALPIIGPFAAELFDSAVEKPLERARVAFLERLARDLHRMGVRVEELEKNEGFATAVAQAAHAYLRTAVTEKRRSLRNAVVNVALGRAPTIDMQELLLDLTASLPHQHVELLKWLSDNATPMALSGPPVGQIVAGFARSQPTLAALVPGVVRELHNRGLVFHTPEQRSLDLEQSIRAGREGPHLEERVLYSESVAITDLGKSLLDFIERPPELCDDAGS